MHIFKTCSLPIENSEEGYGEKRVCIACCEKPNIPELIESRAYENWRNLTRKFEKKQYYGKLHEIEGSRATNLDDNQARDENGNEAMKGARRCQVYEFMMKTVHAFIVLVCIFIFISIHI